jgi:arginine decarboxylase
MSAIVPSRFFLTKGKGQHKEKLASFERALRVAGIAPFNLVKASSIIPPHCRLISKKEGLKLLKPGQIVFLVMSENATNEAQRLISASIGVAIPNDPNYYGYLSEHHQFGQDDKEAGEYVEDLGAYMLATTLGVDLGVEFDTEQIWNEQKNIYQISDKVTLTTKNITQTTQGQKGFWTTAIAAAIFIT